MCIVNVDGFFFVVIDFWEVIIGVMPWALTRRENWVPAMLMFLKKSVCIVKESRS